MGRKRRRQISPSSVVKNLVVSFLAAGLITFFGNLFVAFVHMMMEGWVVPLACRFSYDWFIYMERNGEEFWNKWSAVISYASAVPGLFIGAPLGYRLVSRSRGRLFRSKTKVFIDYKEGLDFYLHQFALYDGIAVVAVTTLALIVPGFLGLCPVVYTAAACIHPLAAWPIGIVLLAAAMLLGAVRAQEVWRARYIRTAHY